jgi:hypothetical protein
MRVLPLILCGGCLVSTTPVTVTPRELLHHVVEFRTSGRATVDVLPSGTVELSAARTFEVEGVATTIRELIANCPDTPPFAGYTFEHQPDCLLLQTVVTSFPLGTRRSFNTHRLLVGIGTVALVALAIGALVFVCSKSSSSSCSDNQ